MNCIKCNKPLSDGAKFCGNCGTPTKIELASKDKFLSVSAGSVFGIRWIKTPRAKIITGIVMLGLALFAFLDSELKDMGVLIVLLLLGGGWYIYKGTRNQIK